MSTGVGWLEAEGTEGKAQETGIPCGVLKTIQGDRAVIRAKMAAKAEGAKGSREEELGWKRKRKKNRRECPKGLCKPEKPTNCGNAGIGQNRVCGQTRC
jgi:hypothetical protein